MKEILEKGRSIPDLRLKRGGFELDVHDLKEALLVMLLAGGVAGIVFAVALCLIGLLLGGIGVVGLICKAVSGNKDTK